MSLTEDDEVLAGEHALGLVDEAAREAADAQFAAAVDVWRERFSPLLGPDRAPPPHLWDRIVRQLPANDPGVRDPARPWRFATFAASAAAAVLLGLLVLRPDGEVPTPAPLPQVAQTPAARLLVAALAPEQGRGAVTVSYDEVSGRMTVTPVALDTDGRTPELWVIPGDGTPRSLGVIGATDPRILTVAADRRSVIRGGVTFAVSLEPAGGSPTGAPTGPVVMTGKLTQT